jgi:hypothetical protein
VRVCGYRLTRGLVRAAAISSSPQKKLFELHVLSAEEYRQAKMQAIAIGGGTLGGRGTCETEPEPEPPPLSLPQQHPWGQQWGEDSALSSSLSSLTAASTDIREAQGVVRTAGAARLGRGGRGAGRRRGRGGRGGSRGRGSRGARGGGGVGECDHCLASPSPALPQRLFDR